MFNHFSSNKTAIVGFAKGINIMRSQSMETATNNLQSGATLALFAVAIRNQYSTSHKFANTHTHGTHSIYSNILVGGPSGITLENSVSLGCRTASCQCLASNRQFGTNDSCSLAQCIYYVFCMFCSSCIWMQRCLRPSSQWVVLLCAAVSSIHWRLNIQHCSILQNELQIKALWGLYSNTTHIHQI